MVRKVLITAIIVAASLIAVSVGYAQGGGGDFPTDNDVNEIAKKLYCPVCPNTPLDVCETQACQDWRAQIKDQLAAGWTEEQILDYFVTQYGERVLAEPERKGFTSLVWLLPVVAALLGTAVVWRVLRGWRARRLEIEEEAPAPPPPIPSEVVSQIEDELRDLR